MVTSTTSTKKVALKARNSPNLITAEVNINEYGDQENQDMARRFSIDKEKYPHYRLFKQDGSYAIMPNHEEKWKEGDIIMFLRDSGVWIGMDDCTERMDQYAAIFMNELLVKKNRDHAEEVMDSVEDFVEGGGSADSSAAIADVYHFVMEKIMSKGDTWYVNEAHRLKSILNDETKLKSITKQKHAQFRTRLNILYSFAQPMKLMKLDDMKSKDEL